MGKRRKAIRWLAAIVIVALIGGVTAVAVDRRIREQVEEEYLNRVAEMRDISISRLKTGFTASIKKALRHR